MTAISAQDRPTPLTVTVTGPGIEDGIGVALLHERAELSRPFLIQAHLVSPDLGAVDTRRLVGSAVTVTLSTDVAQRRINGMVSHVIEELPGGSPARFLYTLDIRPRLWRLGNRARLRLHADSSIPKTIEATLTKAGLIKDRDFVFRLSGNYPPRTFTLQYNESDLDFITRLCEHWGIGYFFEHGERDCVVFTEGDGLWQSGVADSVAFSLTGERLGVVTLRAERQPTPSRYVLRDYNFRYPTADWKIEGKIATGDGSELVEYAANFESLDEANLLLASRLDDLKARADLFSGVAADPVFEVGRRLTVTGHPLYPDLGLSPVAVEAEYIGNPFDAQLSSKPRYQARFTAAKLGANPRPQRTTPKPRVDGVLSGMIEPAADQDYAQIDEWGCYKVRLLFDDQNDEPTPYASVRMAQPYSGADSGFHFPLRPGTEVMLNFVNGDPDRPVIAGAVPNPVKRSPVMDQNNKVNIVRSGGGNQIHIDDTKGAERINLTVPYGNTQLQLGAPDLPEKGVGLYTEKSAAVNANEGLDVTTSVFSSATTLMASLAKDQNFEAARDKDGLLKFVRDVVGYQDLVKNILTYWDGVASWWQDVAKRGQWRIDDLNRRKAQLQKDEKSRRTEARQKTADRQQFFGDNPDYVQVIDQDQALQEKYPAIDYKAYAGWVSPGGLDAETSALASTDKNHSAGADGSYPADAHRSEIDTHLTNAADSFVKMHTYWDKAAQYYHADERFREEAYAGEDLLVTASDYCGRLAGYRKFVSIASLSGTLGPQTGAAATLPGGPFEFATGKKDKDGKALTVWAELALAAPRATAKPNTYHADLTIGPSVWLDDGKTNQAKNAFGSDQPSVIATFAVDTAASSFDLITRSASLSLQGDGLGDRKGASLAFGPDRFDVAPLTVGAERQVAASVTTTVEGSEQEAEALAGSLAKLASAINRFADAHANGSKNKTWADVRDQLSDDKKNSQAWSNRYNNFCEMNKALAAVTLVDDPVQRQGRPATAVCYATQAGNTWQVPATPASPMNGYIFNDIQVKADSPNAWFDQIQVTQYDADGKSSQPSSVTYVLGNDYSNIVHTIVHRGPSFDAVTDPWVKLLDAEADAWERCRDADQALAEVCYDIAILTAEQAAEHQIKRELDKFNDAMQSSQAQTANKALALASASMVFIASFYYLNKMLKKKKAATDEYSKVNTSPRSSDPTAVGKPLDWFLIGDTYQNNLLVEADTIRNAFVTSWVQSLNNVQSSEALRLKAGRKIFQSAPVVAISAHKSPSAAKSRYDKVAANTGEAWSNVVDAAQNPYVLAQLAAEKILSKIYGEPADGATGTLFLRAEDALVAHAANSLNVGAPNITMVADRQRTAATAEFSAKIMARNPAARGATGMAVGDDVGSQAMLHLSNGLAVIDTAKVRIHGKQVELGAIDNGEQRCLETTNAAQPDDFLKLDLDSHLLYGRAANQVTIKLGGDRQNTGGDAGAPAYLELKAGDGGGASLKAGSMIHLLSGQSTVTVQQHSISLSTDQSITLSVGGCSVQIDTNGVTISAGGSSLTLGAGGIQIKGPSVDIKAGSLNMSPG